MTESNQSNPEMRDLGTQQAGAVTSHETKNTTQPVPVNPGHAAGITSEPVSGQSSK